MFYLSLFRTFFFNVNKTFELPFYFKRYGNVDEIVLLTFYFGLLQTSNLNPYKTIQINPYLSKIRKCVEPCLNNLRKRFINVLLGIFENVDLKLLQNIYELMNHF